MLVSDPNVAVIAQRIQQCIQNIQPTGSVYLCVLGMGEVTKTRMAKEYVENMMMRKICTRNCVVVAVGGGVVGDVAGFVAATFCRGVRYVQVPTSLLAMVDSSIGGKVAVDVETVKNVIGSFYNPSGVFIDLEFLKSLPKREFINGVAEIIKIAAIYSFEFFDYLEQNMDKLIGGDQKILLHCIRESIRLKTQIVLIDEKETGIRSILNFGHSLGHAFELGHLLHGEAVAIGMVAESRICQLLHLCDSQSVDRLEKLLLQAKLPVFIPYNSLSILKQRLFLDKKNESGKINFVVLKSIGSPLVSKEGKFTHTIPFEIIESYVSSQVTAPISIIAPSSKSISNRALLLAALGSCVCKIYDLLDSEDTRVMISALLQLGVSIVSENNCTTITGCAGVLNSAKSIFVNNSGTAARFLTTLLATISDGSIVELYGNERMNERPIEDLVTALCDCGCFIEYKASVGCTPLLIHCKGFRGGLIRLKANQSSQFASSILLSAPFAKEPVSLQLLDDVVSGSYIEMTATMLKQFNVPIVKHSPDFYSVQLGVYQNPTFFEVEGDASSAAYLLAVAAISGSSVTVLNVGSNSMQGDSKFCFLLKLMGCKVVQTEFTTTVHGPSELLPFTMDMSTLTDSFLIAAVLASVARGKSTITNIANQRLKECDRIAAMATELKKLGISVFEFKNGLEIVGNPNLLVPEVSIECYKDHRIAMSFGVLRLVCPQIRITDMSCVGKTYPGFWKDLLFLESSINQDFEAKLFRTDMVENSLSFPVVTLIGMRGVGKSSIGTVAKFLGWKVIDLDRIIESLVHMPISSFVKKYGWAAFRDREVEAYINLTLTHPTNALIIAGGGLVETEKARLHLQNQFVILLSRPIEDIILNLSLDANRPDLGCSVADVFQSRQAFYKQCSRFEFVISRGANDIRQIRLSFLRFLQNLVFPPVVNPSAFSFFVSLTAFSLDDFKALELVKVAQGADAYELRVDLLLQNVGSELLETQSFELVSEAISFIRNRGVALPIIYTIRSVEQGGKFVVNFQNMNLLMSLLEHGVRLGCTYVDIESAIPNLGVKFMQKFRNMVKVISSHHFLQPTDFQNLQQTFENCYFDENVACVKVVTCGAIAFETHALQVARDIFKKKHPSVEVIALAMGSTGFFSRVLNQYLTPVTHPLLPFPAAPGQLSVREIQLYRREFAFPPFEQLVPKLQMSEFEYDVESLLPKNVLLFGLVGSPIRDSPSPLFHNAGFNYLEMPAIYLLYPGDSADSLYKFIHSPQFCGASVTIPLKETAFSVCDELSAAAQKIKAVNTIVKRDGKFFGDNTDWRGVYDPLRKRFAYEPKEFFHSPALVLGAGGTSRAVIFALQKLGCTQIYLWNRTRERAVTLANEYECNVLDDLNNFPLKNKLFLVVSTLPPNSDIIFPANFLSSIPLVFDVNFSINSRVYKQALSMNCEVLNGQEMFIAQALVQFDYWSGGRANAVYAHVVGAARALFARNIL